MTESVQYDPIEPDPQNFVGRQTANLQRLVETEKQLGKYPREVLTERQRQELLVEQRGTRCPRCGTILGTLFPVATLCHTCINELVSLDHERVPGCVWWPDLIAKFEGRRQQENPKPEA